MFTKSKGSFFDVIFPDTVADWENMQELISMADPIRIDRLKLFLVNMVKYLNLFSKNNKLD